MEYELYHHGVKGMKWGIRRIRQRMDEQRKLRAKKKVASIKANAHKNHWSEDAKRTGIMRAKNLNQLSNTELKKLNERIRLEKEYANLTAKQKGAGRKFIEGVLTESAKNTASKYVSQYSQKGIEYGTKMLVNFVKNRATN